MGGLSPQVSECFTCQALQGGGDFFHVMHLGGNIFFFLHLKLAMSWERNERICASISLLESPNNKKDCLK